MIALFRTPCLLIALLVCLPVVALAAPVASPSPSLLFVGKPQIYMEVAYLRELEAHGFQVDAAPWDCVTPDLLRHYNAVIVTGYWGEYAAGNNVEAGVRSGFAGLRPRYLAEYIKAGGGVLFALNSMGCYGEGRLGEVPDWLKQFDCNFWVEALSDPTRQVLASPPSLARYATHFAWTDDLAKHPITEGVKNLWYPVGWGGHAAFWSGPVDAGHQWTSIVRTGPQAQAAGSTDVWAELWRKNPPPGPYSLLSVRSVNEGRLAVLGVNPMWLLWSPYDDSLGGVAMKTGEQGRPSDWWKLLENTYRWLAAPSLQMGTYGQAVGKYPPVAGDTPAVPWNQLPFPDKPSHYYRGLVGAHTALSTGKGTVAEWAAAAQAAGWDFLLFTEDLSVMNADKWEKLKAECKGATSDNFVAYPGIEYMNASGYRGFAPLGYVDWFPVDWLTDDGKRINTDRGWTPQKGWGATKHKSGQIMMFLTWGRNGFLNYEKNPSPYWDYKLYNLFPIWSMDHGQPLDNGVKDYLEVCAAAHNPAAYAVNLMYDPAELATARAEGRPHLVVSADPDPRTPDKPGLRATFDRMIVDDVPYGLGTGCYRGWQGPVATQGPALRWMFRGGYQWEGVEFPRYWIERYAAPQEKDWYMPSWYRLKLRLDAESEAGLRDVTIYDGPRIFRRFDPQGQKQYTVELDVVQNQTRHLVAVVTDSQGRQAVSREMWLEQQQMLYNYCGDRVNVPGPIYGAMHGHPFKTFDGRDVEVRRFFTDLVSPDVLIERYLTDWVYKYDELTDTMAWHNWAPHYVRDDYTFEQRGYQWYGRHGGQVSYASHPSQGLYWDGFTPVAEVKANQLPPAKLETFDSTLTLKQPYKLDADGFLPPSVMTWEAKSTQEPPGRCTIVTPDGKIYDIKAPPAELPSGTVIIYAPGPGAAGQSVKWTGEHLAYLVSVKDGPATVKVGVRPGEANQAGQKFTWRTEKINRAVAAGELAKPTWFTVKLGSAQALPLADLHLTAAEGVAEVLLKRSAFDTNSQGLVVGGVNGNWTAVYYEKPAGLIRPIGVWDGQAFAQLPSTKQDVTVIIGNLIRCDQPEVRIEAFQLTDDAGKATGTWQVEAHNPTGQELTVNFTTPAVFDLLKTRQHAEKIAAGSSVRFTLE